MDTVVRRFVADGNAVNLDLGFVPEYCELVVNLAGTNPNIYKWYKAFEDESTAEYGLLITGSSGIVTVPSTAATGIKELDALYHGVLIPDPAGGDDQFQVPTDWAAATDYSSGYTARSATASGSCVRPPTHNGCVYELTTATGSATSEPSSWPTTPGETCTDGGSNVFTCRAENVATRGAQGITIGATTQTDGHVNYVVAWKGQHYVNAGDAALAGASDIV